MPPLGTTTMEKTRRPLAPSRAAGQPIGLVPTRGSLHEGHASLFRQAKRDDDVVVAFRLTEKTGVAFVKRAPGRDEADRLTRRSGRSKGAARFLHGRRPKGRHGRAFRSA